MYSPEVPTDLLETQQVPQVVEITAPAEPSILVKESTPGSYLEDWLRVRHEDLQLDLTEVTRHHFVIEAQRKPGGFTSPAGLEQETQRLMKNDYGLTLIDSEITFPDGENDLNHFKLEMKFTPRNPATFSGGSDA